MQIIINYVAYISLFAFFSMSILGYGYYFKNIVVREEYNSIGESGLFGFIFLYISSVILHFFTSLNLYLTLSLLIFGFFLSINLLIKKINISTIPIKIVVPFFILFLLLGSSNNPHDDVYLYQLPYISYLQNEKLVFGLVNINELTAYSNSFYDLMALFKVPHYNNQAVFLIPTIFFMFFCLLLIENFNKSSDIIKVLIYCIFVLTLLKFTRSKEFGTDTPVLSIIFLVQIFILKFYERKDYNLINKIIIFLSFAFFLKAYAALTILYLVVFFKNIKEFFLSDHKYIKSLTLVFLIVSISSFKNFAHSGCISYPIKALCLDRKIVSWANGHEVVEMRNKGLVAGSKGIKAYIRNHRTEKIITAEEYLKKFKYTYHLNVVKDPDFERLLVVFFIMITFLLLSLFNKLRGSKFHLDLGKWNNMSVFQLVPFILPMIIWWLIIPISKYGGYSYLMFGIFSICIYFKLFKNLSFKQLNAFLIICLIFFVGRNINRISTEYNAPNYSNKSYPLPDYKYQNYQLEKIDNKIFYVTDNLKRCGDIKFPCLERPHFDAVKSVKKIKGYYFFEGIKEKQIESIKIEQNWALNTNNN